MADPSGSKQASDDGDIEGRHAKKLAQREGNQEGCRMLDQFGMAYSATKQSGSVGLRQSVRTSGSGLRACSWGFWAATNIDMPKCDSNLVT